MTARRKPKPAAADEAAREDLARQAEAVTPPGGDAGEILDAQSGTRPDDSDPGEVILTRLRVRARRNGFRRAGRAWPDSAVEVSADAFTAEQIAALVAEPMLEVTLFSGEIEQ